MTEWFYGKEGQQYGPIDEPTLRARIATGEVESRDLIWTEGMDSWTPLARLPQFGENAEPPELPATHEEDLGGVSSSSPYAPPMASFSGGNAPGPALPVTNGLAIASLVCGILSLVFFCFCAGIFLGIPAVICGHLSLNQLNNPENQQQGRSMAIAGLICGYLGLLIFILMMVRGNANFTING